MIEKLRAALRYTSYRLFPDRPKLKRRLRSPSLAGAVRICLDDYGVPHISCKDEIDGYFALGYMHGRDRRFQMELFKFAAQGRIRELLGGADDPKIVEQELFCRILCFRREGREFYEKIPSRDKTILEAYADGINTATRSEPNPMEFRLLGTDPELWQAEDSATVIAWFSFLLCKNWELELGRLQFVCYQLAQGRSLERALRIWKARYDFPPYPIEASHDLKSFEHIPAIAPELVEYLEELDVHFPAPPHVDDNSSQKPLALGLGSNAWAVSGAWTGSKKSALAADPHLPLYLPSQGYMAHLDCNAGNHPFRVIGAGFPGIPAILFGTNGHVAWGIAANWADVTDLYVEKPVAGAPDKYWWGSEQRPFTTHRETFRIRTVTGAFQEETHAFRSTLHGPVLNNVISRLSGNFPLVALKRDTCLGEPFHALRALYKSRGIQEAGDAIRQCFSFVGHWILGDDSGRVAYHAPVRLPKRRRHLGTFPVPGWTQTYEWAGVVSVQELPFLEDPLCGFVATANNQAIHPESFPYPINLEGDIPFRYARIQEKLSAGSNGTPVVEQMRHLQTDSRDLSWGLCLKSWNAALDSFAEDPAEPASRAAGILLNWNGDHFPDGPAPTIFHSLCAALTHRALQQEMPPQTLSFVHTYFNIEPFVFDLITDAQNPVWQERGGLIANVQRALRDVVSRLSEAYGKESKDWNWSRTAPFVLRHPFGQIKALQSYVNRGPFPTRGSNNTIYKHNAPRTELTRFPVMMGPVLRINVDLADLPGSIMAVAGGQSGRPSSKHYDDLLPGFLQGKGVSMDMDMERIAERAKGLLTFRPPTR